MRNCGVQGSCAGASREVQRRTGKDAGRICARRQGERTPSGRLGGVSGARPPATAGAAAAASLPVGKGDGHGLVCMGRASGQGRYAHQAGKRGAWAGTGSERLASHGMPTQCTPGSLPAASRPRTCRQLEALQPLHGHPRLPLVRVLHKRDARLRGHHAHLQSGRTGGAHVAASDTWGPGLGPAQPQAERKPLGSRSCHGP